MNDAPKHSSIKLAFAFIQVARYMFQKSAKSTTLKDLISPYVCIRYDLLCVWFLKYMVNDDLT